MWRPRIVLGLGNPGTRYRGTRHNLGFEVLDRVAAEERVRFGEPEALRGRAWAVELEAASGGLVLAKPRTYMNHSGRAALALCRHYAAAPTELLVVYDDADLELGRLRLRPAGGAGGHNGVRSLIDALGTGEFARLRLGVRGAGREEADLADYVLDPFAPAERAIAADLAERGAQAVREVLDRGLEPAMNRLNALGRPDAAEQALEGEG